MKRILTFMLALAMTLTVMPVTAFAKVESPSIDSEEFKYENVELSEEGNIYEIDNDNEHLSGAIDDEVESDWSNRISNASVAGVSTEDLFLKYPQYLSNNEMEEGIQKATEAYSAVLSSYSDSDEVVACFMSAFSDGISLFIQSILGEAGLTETLYEQYAREAATAYMKSMMSNEDWVNTATDEINTAYKTLKTSYSIDAAVEKAVLGRDLYNFASAYDINITPDDIEDFAKNLYESESLKKDLAAIGEATDLWKIVLEMTEIYAMEITVVDFLIKELEITEQTGSDLYLGLTLLKGDMESDPAEYALKYYGTKKVLKFLSDNIDDLMFFWASGTTVSLVTTFTKVFADYIYVDAKADDLTKATIQTSFVSSIDICLSHYRLKFLQRTATANDIKTYEKLYDLYLAAIKSALDTCEGVCKLKDNFGLGGDCMIWASNIETLYTYDNYIEWCKEAVQHDIEEDHLNSSSGDSTITDALNEETIATRFERIFRLYPPNEGETWNGKVNGTGGSLGFVAKMFNHIFDEIMWSKVKDDYQYILTRNSNVRVLGRLEEDAVTESALKELFADARIGDVIITSGQYDYLHAMILVEVTDNGIIVYDCGSKYGPADEYTRLIQQYEFSYADMADAFSTNGDYLCRPGISVYRAVKKITTTSTSTSLDYVEYDDSVNYIVEDGVLTDYIGVRTTIEIPDGVTSIADNCFKYNTSIKYVYMPDTITEIGSSAFYGCTNLRYVDLSSALNTINSSSFYNCKMLGGIIIPDSVTVIGPGAFEGCTSLLDVELPEGLLYLGVNETGSRNYYGAFRNCTSLKSATIPTTILECSTWSGPFAGCSSLTDVKFNENITQIPDHLFDSCNGIKSIDIPDSVVEIGEATFADCTSLQNVKLSENITVIGPNAFAGCTSLLDVKLPEGLLYLGVNETGTRNYSGAFKDCTSLKSVTIPTTILECSTWSGPFDGCSSLTDVKFNENITQIPDHLFDSCNGIKSIDIPDSVVEIGEAAFADCTSLQNVKLSENITVIGPSAFGHCTSLQNITFNENITVIGPNAFAGCTSLLDVKLPEGLLYLGVNETGTRNYSGAFKDCTSLKSVTIPTTILECSTWSGPFDGCSSLTDVKFNENITQIPDHLFDSCNGIKSIDIPDSVVGIGEAAFNYCTSLEEITINDNVLKLNTTFYECTSLEKITLPDSLTIIPKDMFYNCKNLKTIELPKSFTNIQSRAFYNCTSLELISLPDELQKIESNAFYGCESLSKINLPETLETIDGSAFYECKGLTEITIPENVTSVGSSAFQDCDALTKAVIKGSGTIGTKAFYDCDSLVNIIIGDKVTSIGTNMCYSCDNLTNIKLGKGITTIPDSAFRLCANLTEVTVPNSCTTIAANAFAENTKLAEVYIPSSVTSIQSNSFSYPSRMTFYGSTGSYAEEYAKSRKITFVIKDAILGDANGDGKINLVDSAYLLRYMANWSGYNADNVNLKALDLNGDGGVNTEDATILSRYLAGWDGYETFPAT